MTWNYRMVKTNYTEDSIEKTMWAVYEVYYDEDGTPIMRTYEPISTFLTAYEEEGEGPDNILNQFEMVIKDLKSRPILDEKDINYKRAEELADLDNTLEEITKE